MGHSGINFDDEEELKRMETFRKEQSGLRRKTIPKPYSEIVKIAKEYIDAVGGFEKFVEWGLF